ncbi:MAG TPA: glycosyltransferase [Reyranella sp.]|nr:glycosyltransferase [Reyranella sp.]
MPWSPSDDSAGPRKVLVFEPDAEGHSLEWLEHLIVFAAQHADLSLTVLVAEPLLEPLKRAVPITALGRIRVVSLTPRERRLCTTRPLSLAALARWWTMRRHLKRSGADQGFFLGLDLMCLPLALGLGAAGKGLSGILFRPSVHYGDIGPYAPSRGERLRDLRKTVLYRAMLRNPALERVLSLDPFFPVHARAHYRGGEKVVPLPDPAHPRIEQRTNQVPAAFPAGRIGFLLFGYLAERKGPLVVLDALRQLAPDIAARTAVLFAGRVDPQLQPELVRRRAALEREQPDLWLRVDDRRLPGGELAALVRQSDVVLAPYQRFVGSSGVLLWAALNGRPVLAQDYGLVGRLTREHRLGVSVDACAPAEIAREMSRMVSDGPARFFDPESAQRFASAQTPHRFASLVLSV